MWKAMIWKECRECAIIAGLGAIAMLIFTASAIHRPFLGFDIFGGAGKNAWGSVGKSIPFFIEDGKIAFTVLSMSLAVALGLQQTFWEEKNQTWLFLLHRPMKRKEIMRAKLATGVTIYLILTVTPLAIYSIWAAWPATHASPFFWDTTESWWRLMVSSLVVYLTTFACGLRSARWFGTRLIPMAGVILLAVLFNMARSYLIVTYSVAIALAALLYFLILDQSRERTYP